MATVKQKFGMGYEGIRSFCRMPMCFDVDTLEADIAVIGVCYDDANYGRCGARYGPQAIREASMMIGSSYHPRKGFYHSEMRKHVLSGVRIVDCGDVTTTPSLQQVTFDRVTRYIKAIRNRGAVPVTLGGEHTISIPVIRAFDDAPFHIVQFDAHLDLMDDDAGIKYADANPMKRALEMENVIGLTQIGIRGYVNPEDFWKESDTNERVITITAQEVHDAGAESIVSRIPAAENIYVTLDIDALDPSAAPGSGAPEPGGLDYLQMRTILRGIGQKGKFVGMDITEVNPLFDHMGITANIAAYMIIDMLGAAKL